MVGGRGEYLTSGVTSDELRRLKTPLFRAPLKACLIDSREAFKFLMGELEARTGEMQLADN